eukprot:4949428-Prymnesium_polylepis.1
MCACGRVARAPPTSPSDSSREDSSDALTSTTRNSKCCRSRLPRPPSNSNTCRIRNRAGPESRPAREQRRPQPSAAW